MIVFSDFIIFIILNFIKCSCWILMIRSKKIVFYIQNFGLKKFFEYYFSLYCYGKTSYFKKTFT